MVHSFLKLSLLTMFTSFFIVTLGIGYLTGMSVKYFAISTGNHFLAFYRAVISYFQTF